MTEHRSDLPEVTTTSSGVSRVRAVDILMSKAGQEAIRNSSRIAEAFIPNQNSGTSPQSATQAH
jgi:hypothetical protein